MTQVFNQLLSNESRAMIKQNKFINVYYKELIDNSYNSVFPQEQIDELALNIQGNGLLNPIIVIKQNDGKYRIISGHRRVAAIKHLVEVEKLEQYEDVLSRVLEFETKEDEVVALIASNAQRELSVDDKIAIVKLAEELYENLVNEGRTPKGRKRDWIAAQTGFSPRSIQDYMSDKNTQTSEKVPKEFNFQKELKKVQRSLEKLILEYDLEGMNSDVLEESLQNIQTELSQFE